MEELLNIFEKLGALATMITLFGATTTVCAFFKKQIVDFLTRDEHDLTNAEDGALERFKELKKEAKKGIAEAQNDIAWYYYDAFNGSSYIPNDSKAFKWYKKSAKQGNMWAQNNLGVIYEQVKKNGKLAEEWYIKSAKQGYTTAMLKLGWLYKKGAIVPVDNIKSYMWFAVADRNTDDILQQLEGIMNEKDVAEAKKLAKLCVESGYKDCGDDN